MTFLDAVDVDEIIFDNVRMKILCSKMCLINEIGIFKSSEQAHENYKKKQADKMLEATKRRYEIIFTRFS